jgi:hypothetical protein
MVFEAFREPDSTIGRGLHQMNPAARRFGLQMQSPIGRALIQTKAAVDALIELGDIECSDFRVISFGLIVGDVLHGSSRAGSFVFTFLRKR